MKIIFNDMTFKTILEDDVTKALVEMSYEHHKLHGGYLFSYTEASDIGNGANRDILIITPSTDDHTHMAMDISAESEADTKLYEGIGLTSNGISVTSYNRNRNSSNTPQTLLYHTPDGVSGGTLLFQKHFGSGKQFGGGSRDANEIILKQNTKYLYRVNNATTGNNFISVELNWYEHTKLK